MQRSPLKQLFNRFLSLDNNFAVLKRYLAAPPKALSGAKLGGGVSSEIYIIIFFKSTFLFLICHFFLSITSFIKIDIFSSLISKEKGQQVSKKIDLPVETDAQKLVKFCCGLNILKTGGKEVELKPDSEYPSWLWDLHVDGRIFLLLIVFHYCFFFLS